MRRIGMTKRVIIERLIRNYNDENERNPVSYVFADTKIVMLLDDEMIVFSEDELLDWLIEPTEEELAKNKVLNREDIFGDDDENISS